jgi:hypothetical protein
MSRYSYQRLCLDKNTGTYYDVKPQQVMIMQDPYNPWSYKTKVSTVCAEPPSTNFKVLENYGDDASYYLIEFRKPFGLHK